MAETRNRGSASAANRACPVKPARSTAEICAIRDRGSGSIWEGCFIATLAIVSAHIDLKLCGRNHLARRSVIVFPIQIRPALISAAQSVVDDICQKQLGLMKRAPRMEIDYVASLIESGADDLTKKWRPIFGANIKVRVAGIFCHQSPMVLISGSPPYLVPTQKCELADLLILHSHITPAGKEFWRAVLMQTKIDKGSGVIKPDEPQFWLYDKWPDFSIRSRGFDPRDRDFNADPRSGRYGILSNGRWLVMPPFNPLRTTALGVLSLADFLVAMLYDMNPAQPGRTSEFGRQVYRSSRYDWSQTVRDLLRLTAVRALRHKGKKHGLYAGDMSRMGGEVLQLFTSPFGSGTPPDETFLPATGGDDGISVLVIQTNQSEE
jgi:hypothetical protein